MEAPEKSYRFSDDLESMGFFGFDVKRTPEQEKKLFGWQKDLKPEPKTERSKHFIYRDCGTGAGGFKSGNACAKGGDGGDGGSAVEFVENETTIDIVAMRRELGDKHRKDSCPAAYFCDDEFNTNFDEDTLAIELKELLSAYGGDSYDEISNGGRALKDTEDFSDTTLAALEVCCLGQNSNEVKADFVEMIKGDMTNYFSDFDSDSDISMWENEIDNKAEEFANATFNKAVREAHDMMNSELQSLEVDTKGASLYRGIRISQTDVEGFTEGLRDGVIETQTVQSWSKSSDVAVGFTGRETSKEVPVLFIAKGVVRGVDLNQAGAATQDQEQEVTLPSNNYKVKKVTVHRNSDKKIIGLEVEVNQSE